MRDGKDPQDVISSDVGNIVGESAQIDPGNNPAAEVAAVEDEPESKLDWN